MGTKFANIQIRGNDLKAVRKIVKQYKKSLSNPIQKILVFFFPYYVGCLSEGWITVLNANFGFETIKDVALEMSKKCNYPLISIGYFDDDVLEISLIEKGQIITSLVKGEGLDFYGLIGRRIDVKKFCECLGLEQINCITEIFKKEEIEDIVLSLEKVLNNRLWINADWINDMETNIKKNLKKI